ncbi:uncharacterized protein LOC62_02G003456 [Vanrija pseudolonga]|uniref:AB hydrolase-1 domain-containing protein n=1 Tax=Vanrija pseudolonga TaxID=143232 RepID=A0AAF0Y4P2_9TREE|nr:hypothetical protein LOC62_02G003456 [Vanrija pseudolonga]
MADDEPRPQPGGPEHVMDFAPLHLDHPPASKKTVWIADLDVHVFGLDEIRGSDLPIGVVTIAHGWANKASQMDGMATGVLGEIRRLDREAGGTRRRDVLVVTMDQRNHGERRRHRKGNLPFPKNPHRLVDMAVNITSGMADQTFIYDFLPIYLFPHGERVIEEWMPCGLSLGGHQTWRLLKSDPRIRLGAPIISIPPELFGTGFLFKYGEAAGAVPAAYGPALDRFYLLPEGGYEGKKIFCLYGELDMVIPVEIGLAQLAKNKANAESKPGGLVESYIQKNRGHVITPEMVVLLSAFFHRHGFARQA